MSLYWFLSVQLRMGMLTCGCDTTTTDDRLPTHWLCPCKEPTFMQLGALFELTVALLPMPASKVLTRLRFTSLLRRCVCAGFCNGSMASRQGSRRLYTTWMTCLSTCLFSNCIARIQKLMKITLLFLSRPCAHASCPIHQSRGKSPLHIVRACCPGLDRMHVAHACCSLLDRPSSHQARARL